MTRGTVDRHRFATSRDYPAGQREESTVSVSTGGVSTGGVAASGSPSAEAMIAEARKAFWVMVGFLAVLWILQILNAIDGYGITQQHGILARDVGSLPGVLTAPFLHVS